VRAVIAPASDEVLTHHIAEHRRGCPLDSWRARLCPCERAVAFVCATCWQPVLVVLDRLDPPCEHARQLLDEGRV
jgi:hypothetical protein